MLWNLWYSCARSDIQTIHHTNTCLGKIAIHQFKLKIAINLNLLVNGGRDFLQFFLHINWFTVATFYGIQGCIALEELYLSHNGISKMEGLSSLVNLRVLDVSSNKLTSVDDILNLTQYVYSSFFLPIDKHFGLFVDNFIPLFHLLQIRRFMA